MLGVGAAKKKHQHKHTQISKEMSDADFHERVQPAIAGLFAVNDRGVRVMLLTSIPSYGKRLEDKVVNDQVMCDVAA